MCPIFFYCKNTKLNSFKTSANQSNEKIHVVLFVIPLVLK